MSQYESGGATADTLAQTNPPQVGLPREVLLWSTPNQREHRSSTRVYLPRFICEQPLP